jgi:AraC family transcriptional regulator
MDAATAQVEVVEAHPHQTIAIRSAVPMDKLDIGSMFDDCATRLMSYVSELTIEPRGVFYARYHQFGPDQADVEIGLPVDADLPDLESLEADGVIGVSELPGGRVARLLLVGPYDQLYSAYQALEAYFADNDLTPAGAPWESYLVLPDAVDGDDERLRTEVCWPVAA